MTPCFSQACTMPAAFADDVAACAEAGFPAMEVWLTKLEQHLEKNSVEETRRLLADKNLRLAAAAYQGGLLLSQGDARRAHFEHFKKRLQICEAFAIPTMLLVADFRQRPQEIDLQRAVVSLAEAGRWAAGFNVALALEFRAAEAFCTCLETAVRLTQACGESNVGVCLDVFHFHIGPSKPGDLDMVTKANLFHVQVCDLFGVARELASDGDRILPGDGELPLADILKKLRAIEYDRFISLELLNPQLWQVPPKQLASLSWEAMNRLLN